MSGRSCQRLLQTLDGGAGAAIGHGEAGQIALQLDVVGRQFGGAIQRHLGFAPASQSQ